MDDIAKQTPNLTNQVFPMLTWLNTKNKSGECTKNNPSELHPHHLKKRQNRLSL